MGTAIATCKEATAIACDRVGVPPRMAARALAVLVAACVLPAVSHGVQEMLKGDASLPRQLVLAQAQVSRLVEEKGLLVHSYEGQLAKLTQRLQVMAHHREAATMVMIARGLDDDCVRPR